MRTIGENTNVWKIRILVIIKACICTQQKKTNYHFMKRIINLKPTVYNKNFEFCDKFCKDFYV